MKQSIVSEIYSVLIPTSFIADADIKDFKASRSDREMAGSARPCLAEVVTCSSICYSQRRSRPEPSRRTLSTVRLINSKVFNQLTFL